MGWVLKGKITRVTGTFEFGQFFNLNVLFLALQVRVAVNFVLGVGTDE